MSDWVWIACHYRSQKEKTSIINMFHNYICDIDPAYKIAYSQIDIDDEDFDKENQ